LSLLLNPDLPGRGGFSDAVCFVSFPSPYYTFFLVPPACLAAASFLLPAFFFVLSVSPPSLRSTPQENWWSPLIRNPLSPPHLRLLDLPFFLHGRCPVRCCFSGTLPPPSWTFSPLDHCVRLASKVHTRFRKVTVTLL